MGTNIGLQSQQFQTSDRRWLMSDPKWKANVTLLTSLFSANGVNAVQEIIVAGVPTGGDFTVNFGGVSTGDPSVDYALPYDASAAAVLAAIEGLQFLSGAEQMLWIGSGNVTVTASSTPTVPTLALGSATSGGTFASGNEYWGITVLGPWGESTLSNVVTADLTSDQEQPLTWGTLPSGTTAVNLYRNTTDAFTGATLLVATLSTVTSHTDTGTATTTGTPPALAQTVYAVTFVGQLAGVNMPQLQVASSALTGGTTPAVTTEIVTAGQPGIFPDGYIPCGTVLGLQTSSGFYGPYNTGASDGTQVAAGLLYDDCEVVVAWNNSELSQIGGAMVVNDAVVSQMMLPVQSGPGSIDSDGKTALSQISFRP